MKAAVWIFTLLIASGLLASLSGLKAQNATDKAQSAETTTKKATRGSPSTQETADAKAKGLVWVNTSTRVYHKDGPSYGTTKHGKFMMEEEAKKAGFRIASEPKSRKKLPKSEDVLTK